MNFNRLPGRGKRPSHRLTRIDTDSEEEAFKFNFGGPKLISRPSKSFVLARRLKYSFCVNLCLSVAEISRLRADKALGEFIGGPEEAQLLEVSGQAKAQDAVGGWPRRIGHSELVEGIGRFGCFPQIGHHRDFRRKSVAQKPLLR
jgi:hypothetical protein